MEAKALGGTWSAVLSLWLYTLKFSTNSSEIPRQRQESYFCSAAHEHAFSFDELVKLDASKSNWGRSKSTSPAVDILKTEIVMISRSFRQEIFLIGRPRICSI